MLALYERLEALEFFVAGLAAFKVRAHPGNRLVGVSAGEFELDLAVELIEALLAGELGVGGSEQPSQERIACPESVVSSSSPSGGRQPERVAVGFELVAQLAPGIVNRSIQRTSRCAEPIGKHVDRHFV